MAVQNDIFSQEWIDLIFQNKNKEYGAYQLRKKQYRRVIIAFSVAVVLFVLISAIPAIMHQIAPKRQEKDVRVRVMSDIKLLKPPPPPNQDILKEIPEPPKLRNTIKFTPPVIKPDREVADEEEPKMQQEVIQKPSAIGTVDFNKGTDDIAAPIPKENFQIAGEGTDEQPFTVVEQMPQFPGGEAEMFKFIKENLKYPPQAQNAGVQGKVILNFVVGKDGKITNVKVVRGIGFGCDEEAVRVLEKMPHWNPGKMGGRAVPVYFTFPITFKLS
jgi:protein TonB